MSVSADHESDDIRETQYRRGFRPAAKAALNSGAPGAA
jgi:hypothetical protein